MARGRERIEFKLLRNDENCELYDQEMHELLLESTKQGKSTLHDERAVRFIQETFPSDVKYILGINEPKAVLQQRPLSETEISTVSDYLKHAQEALAEIRELSDDVLRARYEQLEVETSSSLRETKTKLGLEHDKFATFNDPRARADFTKWLRRPVWSIEEAVALSFGKDPDHVNEDSLMPYKTSGPVVSPFKQNWEERLVFIGLALGIEFEPSGNHEKPIKPKEFMEWCIKENLPDLPIEFHQALNLPSYDELQAKYEALRTKYNSMEKQTSAAEEFAPKSKRPWFIIFLTMAVAHYEHSFGERISRAPAKIRRHIEDFLTAENHKGTPEFKVPTHESIKTYLDDAEDYLKELDNNLLDRMKANASALAAKAAKAASKAK